MIEGIVVKMSGVDYTVPPLNLKALKRLQPKLANLIIPTANSMPSTDQMDVMVEVIHAALVRNYPDVTIERLEEMVDMSNLGALFEAVLNTTGLVKRAGEAMSQAIQ